MFVYRIVERGYYSERDAAHVIKQILEAVAVRLLPSLCVLTVKKTHHHLSVWLSLLTLVTVRRDHPAPSVPLLIRLLVASSFSVESLHTLNHR